MGNPLKFAKNKNITLKSLMGILDEIVAKKKERLSYTKSSASLKDLKSKISDIEKPRDFRAANEPPHRRDGGVSKISDSDTIIVIPRLVRGIQCFFIWIPAY